VKSKTLQKKEHILDVALRLAREEGYHNLRRDRIASEAGVATGLLNFHYGTLTQLKRAVMRRAIQENETLIVAQGVILGDPVAIKAEME
jgi:AcrR family transcriptional regulator